MWARLTSWICGMLPFRLAILLSKQLLAAQGFGAGASISTSGEKSVFRLIKADAPILFDVAAMSENTLKPF